MTLIQQLNAFFGSWFKGVETEPEASDRLESMKSFQEMITTGISTLQESITKLESKISEVEAVQKENTFSQSLADMETKIVLYTEQLKANNELIAKQNETIASLQANVKELATSSLSISTNNPKVGTTLGFIEKTKADPNIGAVTPTLN